MGHDLGIHHGRDPRSSGDHQRHDHPHVGRVRRPFGARRGRAARGRARTRLEGRPVPLQLQRVPRGTVRHVQDPWRRDQRQLPLSRRGAVVPARQRRRRGVVLPLVAERPRRPSGRPAAEPRAAGRGRRRRAVARRSRRALHRAARRPPAVRPHRTQRRRHLHALHRWHHRHAEGRHVPDGRHHRVLRPARLPGGRPAGARGRLRPRADGARSRGFRRDPGVDHRCAADARHGPVARHLHAPHDGWPRRHADQPEPRCARVARARAALPVHAQHDRRRLVRQADHQGARRGDGSRRGVRHHARCG